MFGDLFSRKPKSRANKSMTRRIRLEQLESRQLLSVSPFAAMAHASPVAVVTAFHGWPAPPTAIGVASQLQLTAPANATVGAPVWVQVTALDAKGHLVPNYKGTVTLTSTDPSIDVVIPGTAFWRGQAWVQVTFSAVNTAATLTATDNSTPPLVATSSPINVAAAAVAASLARTDAARRDRGRARLGGSDGVDSNGNRVPNYSGTVTLTSTDPSIDVVVPGTAFKHGQAWVQVTFSAVNTAATLTATDNSSPPLMVTSSPINVAAAPVAASLALETPPNATVGVPVWVQVTALDANGHRVPNYGGTVTLTSTDPSVNVVVPSTAFEFGQAWVQVTFSAVNTAATLTATDNSSPPLMVTSSPINVAAAPVAASLARRRRPARPWVCPSGWE